ncbi:MAG: MFS transporter, partial [Actinomycetota bacterium]
MAALTVMRRLVAPVYLPMALASTGTGMLIPLLPLYLDDVGANLRTTAIVLAAGGVGAVAGGLPAGAMVARVGERRVLVAAIVTMALSSLALGLTETAVLLVALRLGWGAASIALRLSRQTYITRRVPASFRGRAMASIGGSFRIGLLVGPALGGVLADRIGFSSTFVVAGAITATSLGPPLLRSADPPITEQTARAEQAERIATNESDTGRPLPISAILRRHRRLLLAVGIVPMLTMTVRDGRFVVLPLIGDDLGLTPSVVGIIVSIGTAADLLLFPVAGYVMDRFGRLAALLPFYALIALGLALLAAAGSTTEVIVAGTVIGVGNGLGSGALLTLGSDLAPRAQPGPFLAAFGTLQDVGKVVGPLVVGIAGDAVSLAFAAGLLAALAAGTGVWLAVVVGETSDGGGRLVEERELQL